MKKGPCTQLLPNVGVPKILADRKFPILRRVLQSCNHPNAVTVFLLTLIAFLHPCSLSFTLSFSLTEYFIYSTEQRYAGLMLVTLSQAPDAVCSVGYNSLCSDVTITNIWQLSVKKPITAKGNDENNVGSRYHVFKYDRFMKKTDGA